MAQAGGARQSISARRRWRIQNVLPYTFPSKTLLLPLGLRTRRETDAQPHQRARWKKREDKFAVEDTNVVLVVEGRGEGCGETALPFILDRGQGRGNHNMEVYGYLFFPIADFTWLYLQT
ncbi:hypothetical protein HWV62_37155 [Athelia sp. TMB]|nr:hypothetical protein HWV62_37155 [Athelia sp. TMB]